MESTTVTFTDFDLISIVIDEEDVSEKCSCDSCGRVFTLGMGAYEARLGDHTGMTILHFHNFECAEKHSLWEDCD